MLEDNRQIYQFDQFHLDVARRQLLRDGEVVPLYSKAFDLLLLLVQNNGRDLSKDQILERVWPGQVLEESNLTVNMSAVRRALGEKAAQPRYLVTIPGRGYRFVADVTIPQDHLDGVLIETQTISEIVVEETDESITGIEPATETRLLPPHVSISGRIWRHKILAALVILILAIGAGAVGLFLRARKTEGAIESIAVLPFANASGDPNTEYLSDGITESIINSFAQLPRLRVIPRSSVFRYKGQQLDPQEIGRKLGVRAVLTGRVVEHGDKINVQTELVDVDKNSELWGEQYDRALADLQSVQADISSRIITKLRLTLTTEQQQLLATKHTPPPEAYQAYLKGSYFFNLETQDADQKAIDLFSQAVKIDPNYALAYAGLSKVYTQISARYMPPLEAMAKAKDATLKALALDGSLSEAHLGLARIHLWSDWDFPGAEQEVKRAIELNPNEPSNHALYGEFLGCTMGRFDEGVAEMHRALELDPLSPIHHYDAAYLFYCLRQPEHIIEEANKILELDPGSVAAHRWLGTSYLMQGHYEQAISEYKTALRTTGTGSRGLSALGYAYAVAGRRDEALKIVAQLQTDSQQRYISPMTIAFIYSALGEKDRAFEWLEKAFAERNDGLPSIEADPWLDNLHSDPRFDNLLQRIGLKR